jgi:hypothetical protein
MVENLQTYINRKGFPIMRRCFNCKFWSPYSENDNQTLGYCKAKPLYFAFTLQPTVFTITKDFYLCEQHSFKNEEVLAEVSEKITMKDALKKKEDIIHIDKLNENI